MIGTEGDLYSNMSTVLTCLTDHVEDANDWIVNEEEFDVDEEEFDHLEDISCSENDF